MTGMVYDFERCAAVCAWLRLYLGRVEMLAAPIAGVRYVVSGILEYNEQCDHTMDGFDCTT